MSNLINKIKNIFINLLLLRKSKDYIEIKLNGIFPVSTIYNFLTDKHEPFQELLIKDLFDNERDNIIIHSWELVNSDVVLKTLDRSAFLYNSTSVAMGVRSYFDEELGRGETKKIKLIYKGKEYYADFVLDNLENPRSSIRWNNDFGDIIKETLPEYYSLFKNEKDRDSILLPKIKFQKEKEDIYLIDFIM